MKLFSYLSVAVLLLSSIALAAYSPDLLSALIVGLMCIIALAGCIHGLLPTISITGGLLNGQKSIRKASETEGSSAWVAALQIERFFQQKTLDGLFEDYREKVQHQRETGQIVSDLDEVLNEDVLALHTWKGVIAQLPGTLTGLGILGTFVGLLLGLELPENFKTPFFATNFSGFWSRWHISFSSWLQDYLFMPLAWAGVSGLSLIHI